MEEVARLIGQYGFPIVMVVWFAWRLEQKLEEQAHVVRRQTNILLLLYAAQTGKTKDEISKVLGDFDEDEGKHK